MTLSEIEAQLKEPFPFDAIDFLPKGKIEREGKTLCMALPYADPRVYQDRLNAVAYGEWSTPSPVVVAVGNKLVCYVTVMLCGVPHTDVGEADAGENQGTEAWAQAFKRACSQFGLGRYLYDLEKEWVPFNPQRKQIELDKAGKSAIVRKMYQKAGIGTPVSASGNGRKAVEADKPILNGDGSPAFPPGQPKPDLLEQGIAQVKKDFEEMYPDFVKKIHPDDWFEHFQKTALGYVPSELLSADIAKLRQYLSDKKKKTGKAATSGK